MLNVQNRTKKLPKIPNVTIVLTTLVETLATSIHEFWVENSDVFFQRRCRMKILPPYGFMLMKTKKMAKIQNLKFHNSLNNFGRDPP